MMRDWTIHKVNFYLLIFVTSLLFAQVKKEVSESDSNIKFASSEDQKIAFAVLGNFSKQCNYVLSFDSAVLSKLEENSNKLSSDVQSQAFVCYSQHMPNIKNTSFIYKKLCSDLTQSGIPLQDETVLRMFVSVQEYKKGIAIYHALLNDCLQSVKAPSEYIVDVFLGKKEFNFLSLQIKSMRKEQMFSGNQVNFR